MTALQSRLFAGRAVRAVQAQEQLARRLRPAPEVPAQRSGGDAPGARVTVVDLEPGP
jgi:hypothetical protein